MRHENYSNREIVRWFHENGRPDMTSSIVTDDWLAVRKSWLNRISDDVASHFDEELAANEKLLHDAWVQYRRALERVERVERLQEENEIEVVRHDDDEDGSVYNRDIKRQEANSTKLAHRRSQHFKEQTYWWNQISRLREHRARLLGLTSSGVNVNIDNRSQNVSLSGNGANKAKVPEKIYIGFDPDADWPSKTDLLTGGIPVEEEPSDGVYEDVAIVSE